MLGIRFYRCLVSEFNAIKKVKEKAEASSWSDQKHVYRRLFVCQSDSKHSSEDTTNRCKILPRKNIFKNLV